MLFGLVRIRRLTFNFLVTKLVSYGPDDQDDDLVETDEEEEEENEDVEQVNVGCLKCNRI